MEQNLKKALLAAVLVLLAVLSFLFLADWASDAETHAGTIRAIDSRTDTVLKLSAASALASAGISAIPGDTATPIAEKLSDFTEYFLLILCVLYTEKYLVTILGAAVFKLLIPAALVLVGVSLWRGGKALRLFAGKIAVIALALFLVIPVSLRISDMIYGVYAASVENTVEQAESLTDQTAPLADVKEDKGLVASVLERISETAASLTDKAADTLNRFVENLAVMIVTSCIIPILVLLFFLWVIKLVTGADLTERLRKRGEHRKEP